MASYFIDDSDYLEHYGVLGMKWGVRKDGKPQGFQGSGKGHFSKTIGTSKVSKVSNSGIPMKKNLNASIEEDLKAVNPGIKTHNKLNNCMYCSTAYDLRRRGLDVKAGKTSTGTDFEIVSEWYKDAELKKTAPVIKNAGETVYDHYQAYRKDPKAWEAAKKTNQDKTIKELAKQGDGARGNLGIWWESGGGHSLAYEVKGKNVVILDTQSGKEVDHDELFKRVSPAKEVNYCRTDNKEPNYDVLKDYGIISAKGVKSKGVDKKTAREIRNYRNQVATEKYNEGRVTSSTKIKVSANGATASVFSDKARKAAKAGHKAAQQKYSQTAVHAVDDKDVRKGIALAKAVYTTANLVPLALLYYSIKD